MVETHDFKAFPELTDNQMNLFYFDSPHKQITENFFGNVSRIIDGDTLTVKWFERNKPIIVRMDSIAAPELDKVGGIESKKWLEGRILKKDVEIAINEENRVGKWGRIIGTVIHQGLNVNYESIEAGKSIPFEEAQELQEEQLFSLPRIA